MKFKHVLASCALAMVTAFGVAAVKVNEKEAIETKAEDFSKMFAVVIDFKEAATFENFHYPEVHYYGTNVDAYAELHKVSSEEGNNLYTVNIPLTVSQTVDHIQFLFKQNNDKWSNAEEVAVAANKTYNFSYSSWGVGDNWNMTYDGYGDIRVQYYGNNNNITEDFVRDLDSRTWKATIEISEAEWGLDNHCQIHFGAWNRGALRNEWADLYTSDHTLNYFDFKEPGKYDIVIENGFEDGGIISMYKYGEEDSYIYYVSDSAASTNNKIYSFAGGEQFGSFPGTAMSSYDVTGVLHFQGNEYKFYKIPVKIGYPLGDLLFMFAYDDDNKSSARFLVPGAAYWWSGDANVEAGAALDYLVKAEELRNAVSAHGDIKDYSVCGVSQKDAEDLVGMYNSLGDGVAATYVDSTYVKTYDPQDSSKETWISYYEVEQQLVKIASGSVSSEAYFADVNAGDNSMIMIVIISVASILTFGGLILLKKKRQ